MVTNENGKWLNTQMLELSTAVAQQFSSPTPVASVQPYGDGNLNDTYLVTLAKSDIQLGDDKFILQRINQSVFHEPALIMQNMEVFTQHIDQRLRQGSIDVAKTGRRWEMPKPLSVHAGDMAAEQNFYVDEEDGFWRALTFVNNSVTHSNILDERHAYEAGHALGQFHNLLSDLEPTKLHDTLKGFHITPQYLRQYDIAQVADDLESRTPVENYCHQFVLQRRFSASVLEDAKKEEKLLIRAIHGDPKVNNIMIDQESNQAVSIVDLDTVKPGLVHYDIGDCLRSCCNPLGEETTDFENVYFDMQLCQAILEGYISETRHFFTAHDYDYIYDSIRLIAFELGLRFFTDFLAGNVYFKTDYDDHNLARAVVQFRLAESIEAQADDIKKIVNDLRAA